MVRKEIIRKRLQKLDEYLAILEGLRAYRLEEFTSSPELYGSAERFLQLAIETIIDMGNHVVADDQLGVVNWYSDIPRILQENGVIDSDISDVLVKMIGFRNILVHEYIDIDRSLVYDILQYHLDDFQALRLAFSNFL